jgi:hypothetical protein
MGLTTISAGDCGSAAAGRAPSYACVRRRRPSASHPTNDAIAAAMAPLRPGISQDGTALRDPGHLQICTYAHNIVSDGPRFAADRAEY